MNGVPHRVATELNDIRQFANLLGRRLDSPEIKRFLRTWKTRENIDWSDDFPVGEIPVHDAGFDIILAFREDWGGSRGKGKSEVWACYMRFFSPEYCKGKKVSPYVGAIIDDVTLPLTKREVRKRLGKPGRSMQGVHHRDEYAYEDCIVNFVYPSIAQHVVFVELSQHSVVSKVRRRTSD